jgi:hypothetical protein
MKQVARIALPVQHREHPYGRLAGLSQRHAHQPGCLNNHRRLIELERITRDDSD